VNDGWEVRRRPRRTTAMQRHRFVEARVGAARSAVAFPGTPMPEPAGARERLVSSGASILLHGALLVALWLVAHAAKERIEEKLIEVTRVTETREEPAARPRAIAESMAKSLAPAPMALAPQIVNPTVIQPRIPNVQAAPVQIAELQPVQAPREITAPTLPDVPQARAVPSPIALPASAPRVVDTSGAPQLSGPVDLQAPTGTLSGPRQVSNTGNTVGVGEATALGTGSSVQDGIASDRDVLGGKTGDRASVNTAVGANGGRGTGGTGTGLGGMSFDECMALPEVQTYMARLKERVESRWRSNPTGMPEGSHRVTLRFRLDPSGSASEVEFRGTSNDELGRSAADAMRAASPFDQMEGRARCLAGNYFNATFKLDTFAGSN
jgi:hypothetical protein